MIAGSARPPSESWVRTPADSPLRPHVVDSVASPHLGRSTQNSQCMEQDLPHQLGPALGGSLRRLRLFLVASLLLAAATALRAESASPDPDGIESRRVQASLLCKFYFYVGGLPSQSADADTPFTIGILGDDPFGEYLDEVGNLRASGRPVRVRRSDSPFDLISCDLIYISRSEQSHLSETLQTLGGRPHMLVSDIVDFVERGGTIGFVMVDGSLGFEINQLVANATKLQLSAHLLRLAAKVVR